MCWFIHILRLNTIKLPKVSSIDIAFPSSLAYDFPSVSISDDHPASFDFHIYTPTKTNTSSIDTAAKARNKRNKRESGSSTSYDIRENPQVSNTQPIEDSDIHISQGNNEAVYKTDLGDNKDTTLNTKEEIAEYSFKTLMHDNQDDEANVYRQPQSAAMSSKSDKDDKNDNTSSSSILYILIGVFLTLDVVLWIYRLSWLSTQLHATTHGYADRIPTGD